MRRALLLFSLVLSLAGCPEAAPPPEPPTDDDDDASPPGGGVEDSLYSGEWTVPDRSMLDDPPLTPHPDGGYIVHWTAEASLALDPEARTPLSAAAECIALVIACYEPGLRTRLGCLENVEQCGSETPWTGDEPFCCAAGCAERYRSLREAGYNQPDGVVEALLGQESCAPGLDAWREAAR